MFSSIFGRHHLPLCQLYHHLFFQFLLKLHLLNFIFRHNGLFDDHFLNGLIVFINSHVVSALL